MIYVRVFCLFFPLGNVLTFRFSVHLGFTFDYGVREHHFLLLCVAVQVSQHTYWRDCLFSIVYSCLLCCRLNVRAWVYLWALHSVLLIYLPVFVASIHYYTFVVIMVQPEIRKCDSSGFIILSQNRFGYWGSSVFPYKFLNYLF